MIKSISKHFSLNFSIILLSAVSSSPQSDLEKFTSFIDTSFQHELNVDPVWATNIGIFENGDELPVVSIESIEKEYERHKKYLTFLSSIDTAGWNIDSQIDYILQISKYRMKVISYEKKQWFRTEPDFYLGNIYAGIIPLFHGNQDNDPKKLQMLLKRIENIPDFLKMARANIKDPYLGNAIKCYSLMTILERRIKAACILLARKFPDKTEQIKTAMGQALYSLFEYSEMLNERKDISFIANGKDFYDSTLAYEFLLDFDSDSAYTIAEAIFNNAYSRIRELEASNEYDEKKIIIVPKLLSNTWDFIASYYQNYLEHIKEFIEKKEILDIPQGALDVEFVEFPDFLKDTYYGDFYAISTPFDSIRGAQYYIHYPISERLKEKIDSNYEYSNEIRKNIIKYILPGAHYRNFMTERNRSINRKIQNNNLFGGWTIYMEGLLIDQEYWRDNKKVILEFYKDLRNMALLSMLEIGIHANMITPDSAKSILVSRLGSDTTDFNVMGETLTGFYSTHTSLILGYHLFEDMQEKARAKEGDSFDLREFHDKVLSEGRIPPSLIAKKYGWE